DDYPYLLSRDWDYGHRAARIVERLETLIDAGPLTVETMATLQMDNQFPAAQLLQEAYADIEVEEADVQAASDLLADWDGHNDADSSGAVFANVLWNHLTKTMMNTHIGSIPRGYTLRYIEFYY